MQDGATPHTASSNREFLRHVFQSRVIGRFFDMPWPPNSPDLTPLDIFIWKYLKHQIYTGRDITSIELLKRRICKATKMLAKSAVLQNLGAKVIGRFNRCIQANGCRL